MEWIKDTVNVVDREFDKRSEPGYGKTRIR